MLEDTNDIAFTAVTVGEGAGVEPGVWFRLGIGGITGHQDFAKYGGVYVKPEDAVAVADAIVRVFIANGDRTDRKKARLKYVLDAWGLDKFLAEVEAKLGRHAGASAATTRSPRPTASTARRTSASMPQKQPGKVWAGVALPVGKLTCEQMRGLARIARELGDGDIRLTVWQNLLISGIARGQRRRWSSSACARSGSPPRPPACAPGSSPAPAIPAASSRSPTPRARRWRSPTGWSRASRSTRPINIHLTGCPHSCAQHYIGDIGMLACRVPVDAAGEDTVEGFHVFVGGGFGADAGIGRELYRDVKAEDCPRLIERILEAYVRNRACAEETFLAFTRRHEIAGAEGHGRGRRWRRRMSVQTKVPRPPTP